MTENSEYLTSFSNANKKQATIEETDDFYDTLINLKNEQRKKLLLMKDLYNRKLQNKEFEEKSLKSADENLLEKYATGVSVNNTSNKEEIEKILKELEYNRNVDRSSQFNEKFVKVEKSARNEKRSMKQIEWVPKITATKSFGKENSSSQKTNQQVRFSIQGRSKSSNNLERTDPIRSNKPLQSRQDSASDILRRHSFTDRQNDSSMHLLNNPQVETSKKEIDETKQLKDKLSNDLEMNHIKNRLKRTENLSNMSFEANQNNRTKFNRIPNYDRLYQKFITQLEMKKAQKSKNISVKPFVFCTASRTRVASSTDSNKASRSMSLGEIHQASYTDIIPVKSNQTQKLRENINKNKLNEITNKENEKEHMLKIKQLREKRIHEAIQDTIKYDPKEMKKKINRQTRQLRLEQKRMDDEYEKKINEIVKKAQEKKLQVQKNEEENVIKMVEKKYEESLQKAGLPAGYKIE